MCAPEAGKDWARNRRKHRPKLARNRTNSTKTCPEWTNAGTMSTTCGAEFGPEPANFSPKFAESHQSWPGVGQHWPGIDQTWPAFKRRVAPIDPGRRVQLKSARTKSNTWVGRWLPPWSAPRHRAARTLFRATLADVGICLPVCVRQHSTAPRPRSIRALPPPRL